MKPYRCGAVMKSGEPCDAGVFIKGARCPIHRTEKPISSEAMRRTRIRRPARDLDAEREWELARQRCKDRARGWCQARFAARCHDRGSHAHHVLPRSRGGDHDDGNLLWCCNECHAAIHDRPIEAAERGLLRLKGM